jgi:hypothetical protein
MKKQTPKPKQKPAIVKTGGGDGKQPKRPKKA